MAAKAAAAVSVAKGGKFTPSKTGNQQLDAIQRDIAAVFDQLEDMRRGILVAAVFSSPGVAQLGEQMVARYTGPGNQTWTLPKANLRGAARGQVVWICNDGPGTLTVAAAGSDRVNSAGSSVASFTIATRRGAVLISDGATRWTQGIL